MSACEQRGFVHYSAPCSIDNECVGFAFAEKRRVTEMESREGCRRVCQRGMEGNDIAFAGYLVEADTDTFRRVIEQDAEALAGSHLGYELANVTIANDAKSWQRFENLKI